MEQRVAMSGGYSSRKSVGRLVVFVSALLGTTSHVFLDSLMHSDMRPLFPFSDENHVLYASHRVPNFI